MAKGKVKVSFKGQIKVKVTRAFKKEEKVKISQQIKNKKITVKRPIKVKVTKR